MKERRDARRAERLIEEGLALVERDPAAARAKFAEARRLDPACYPAFLNGATIEAREGRFAAALPLARRATELRPDAPDAWAALGHALLRTEGARAAVAAFEKVVSLEPGSPRGASGLAVALTDLREGDAAIAQLRRALETSPDDGTADELQLLIGLNELRLGRLAQAAAAFQEARARRPGFPEPAYFLGVVRAKLGDAAEAARLIAAATAAGLDRSPLEVGDWLRAECARGPYPREALFEDPDAGAWLRFRVDGPGRAAFLGVG
jgi:tetratricopeptide (TPR) repeat protein